MVELFKALSDETRLRILALVWDGEMCVCEIEEALGLTQSNASRHLTALKKAGLLISSKHAQWAYYKLNDAFISGNRGLADWLAVRLKALPTYSSDIGKALACRDNDMCRGK